MFSGRKEQQYVRVRQAAPGAGRKAAAAPESPADLAGSIADQPLAPAPGGTPGKPRRVAVLVAHGMGQQVKFETLELIVDAVRRASRAKEKRDIDVEVDLVRQGEKYVPRAITRLGSGEAEREVHFFEAWWAPLAEGRISTAETFWFLVQAGWQGASRTLKWTLTRYLFGTLQAFPLRVTTLLGLLAAVGTLAGLGVMNAVVLAAAASRTVGGLTKGWPSGNLLIDLTTDFTWFVLVVVVLMLVGVGLPRMLRRVGEDGSFHGPPAAVSHAGNWLMRLAAVFTAYSGLRVAWHVAVHTFAGEWTPASPRLLGLVPFHREPDAWVDWLSRNDAYALVVWGLILVVSWRVRHFLLQYVGDVAVYVSAHTVNRFYEARQAIQAAGELVGRCVYGLRDEAGEPAYDRVVVVGHSLGSVVAYDLLNTMVREDPDPDGPAGVIRRTTALVTFGSPLDKTAFVFSAQASENSQVRDALAASVQPLIADYRRRPRRWINLYSDLDWISGDLTYYDRQRTDESYARLSPEERRFEDERRVDNRPDPTATTPLQAHTEYWTGPVLASVLWDEIMRTDESDRPGVAR